MSFSLKLLNLYIGMCRGLSDLPRFLFDLGYRDVVIEKRFGNADGEVVQPELIAASSQTGNALLFEWKGGSNTDDDQLRRYSRVDSRSLEQRALVEAAACRTHDIVVHGHEDQAESLQIGLTRGPYAFPLIGVAPSALQLVANQFNVAELTDSYRNGVEVDWDHVSTAFVPLDPDSSLAEVAELAIPVTLKYMSELRPRVTTEELCVDVCPTWGMLDASARQQLKARMRAMLQEAAANEFRDFFRYSGAGEGSITISENPLEFGVVSGPAFTRLATAQRKLLERLSGRSPVNSGDQLDLGMDAS